VRLSVYGAAVFDSAGNVTLFVPKGRADNTAATKSAAMTNVQNEGVRDAEAITIPKLKLDDVLRQQNISRVSLLKIDTQGHEMFVLRGAIESLTSRRIEAVYAENDLALTRAQGVDPASIYAFMTGIGWELFKSNDYKVVNGVFRPSSKAVALKSMRDAGYDVLWVTFPCNTHNLQLTCAASTRGPQP